VLLLVDDWGAECFGKRLQLHTLSKIGKSSLARLPELIAGVLRCKT
jgi:hypothetical protein